VKVPAERIANFDFYFYDLSDPRAVPAASRMIPKDHLYAIRIGQVRPEEILLGKLLDDLDNKHFNRLPVFDDNDRPLYVIHRSMFERFLADRIRGKRGGPNFENLTLNDFLSDEAMKQFVKSTFVHIPNYASLDEAKQSMNAVADCRDAFITATGAPEEPILGWLTNVAMA
jgi:hypothetical protein